MIDRFPDHARFCPACGSLVMYSSRWNRCSNERHPLYALAASPERYAAYQLGGSDAVRALSEHPEQLPGDVPLAHRGHCDCEWCETRRMIELSA